MRLFRWLAGWLWPQVRREIFAFHDGRRTVHADPLRLLQRMDERGEWRDFAQRVLAATGVDRAKLSPELAAQASDTPRMVSDLAAVVRDVFGVKPVGTGPDGLPEGLTDVECVAVLSDFLVWCADTSEAYRPLALSPARPAPSPADADTGEFAACTSTAT